MLEPLVPDATRAEFRERGFVVLRGLMDRAQVAELDHEMTRIATTIDPESGAFYYYEHSARDRTSEHLRRIERVMLVSKLADELFRSNAIAGRVSELFGEQALVFKDKLNLKLPNGAGFRAHIDGHFRWLDAQGNERKGWLEHASWFINVVIGVDASTVENGCVEIAPINSTYEILGNDFDAILDKVEGRGPDIKLEDDGRFGYVPLELAPGDVALFDWRCAHRSGPNRSTDARRILYATYNRASDGDQMDRYYESKRTSVEPLARKALTGAP